MNKFVKSITMVALLVFLQVGLARAVPCSDVAVIAGGAYDSVGLKADGTVVGTGDNSYGQLNVSTWTNIKAIAAGAVHTVGLKEDGTVVAVGANWYGQTDVSTWTNIKAIAASFYHTVGLKEDGTVVAVGANWDGQLNVSTWTNIKAIATGEDHTVGLKEDGTVVAVGNNAHGQLNVSSWTNIKAIAAGVYHTVGLKEDGTVVAVGYNGQAQLNVSSWRDVKAIAAGSWHTVGLKEDGTVVAVGQNIYGQLDVSSWTNIKAIAAGFWHTAGLKQDGTVDGAGNNAFGQLNFTSWRCEAIQDVIPPITTAMMTGTLGSNEWYLSDVEMTLTATDNNGGSGVKELRYKVDGVTTITPGDTAKITVSGDGVHYVSFYAADNAGNLEPVQSMKIAIDKTAPRVAVSVNPGLLWPPDHRMVDVAVNGGASDDASGVESVVFTVTDEYGKVQPVISGFNTTIPLESWRAGTDMDGRLYTVTAVATDKAGNQSTGTTTVLVPHDMR